MWHCIVWTCRFKTGRTTLRNVMDECDFWPMPTFSRRWFKGTMSMSVKHLSKHDWGLIAALYFWISISSGGNPDFVETSAGRNARTLCFLLVNSLNVKTYHFELLFYRILLRWLATQCHGFHLRFDWSVRFSDRCVIDVIICMQRCNEFKRLEVNFIYSCSQMPSGRMQDEVCGMCRTSWPLLLCSVDSRREARRFSVQKLVSFSLRRLSPRSVVETRKLQKLSWVRVFGWSPQ